MKKLSLNQIKELKEGDKVFLRPTDAIIRSMVEPLEFTVMARIKEDIFLFPTIIHDELVKARKEYLVALDKDFFNKMIVFNLEEEDKNFDFCLKEENAENTDVDKETEEDSLSDKVYKLLLDGISENGVKLPVEVLKEVSNSIAGNIREEIKEEKYDSIRIGMNLLEDREIEYVVKTGELKFRFFDEEVKEEEDEMEQPPFGCGWYEDEDELPSEVEVEVPYNFLLRHMYNEDVMFRIEHPVYDEVIERAIQMEEEWMDSEEMSDTLNIALGAYLDEDYHTYMEIMRILTFYAEPIEIETIFKKGTIYAI